jgi:hypothetical protein
MSELTTLAKHAVQENFPDLAVSFGEPPNVIVTVAPKHPEFGPIEVMDDEVEFTVYCGRFTHVHLSNYDDGITPAERRGRLVESLIAFLREVFADRMVFWGSHRGGGGCRQRDSQGIVFAIAEWRCGVRLVRTDSRWPYGLTTG